MFKPIELFIGFRYTRAKRRNHFISFITLVSMLGIALGITALITVISVMNGFQEELRERILGMTAHATIRGDGQGMSNWLEVAKVVADHPDVVGYAPYVQGEGMLSFDGAVNGTLIRGISPADEPQVSDVGTKMRYGELADLQSGAFNIILGVELARVLGAIRGDKVTLIIPQVSVTPAGLLPRLRRFTVVGIFEAGMYEYDSTLALLHIEDAAKLMRMPGQVSGVRLKLQDMFESIKVTRELVRMLPGDYWIGDWTRQHANFFRAVQIEKVTMFIILMLIVAVAAFNLVSTLVMVVVDKEADIAILRTLGATPRRIMGIFIVQGAVIGIIGTGLGLLGGISLATHIDTIVPMIERLFEVQFLNAEIYYISELPSKMVWRDVLLIGSIALVLSLCATLYPAWRASRVQPAEALRYE